MPMSISRSDGNSCNFAASRYYLSHSADQFSTRSESGFLARGSVVVAIGDQPKTDKADTTRGAKSLAKLARQIGAKAHALPKSP